MSEKTHLRLCGAGVVVAVAVACFGAYEVTEQSGSGDMKVTLHTATIGDGVDSNTEVRLRGLPIGHVKSVKQERVGVQQVVLDLHSGKVNDLTTSFDAQFVSSNVFGSTALELTPKSGGDKLADGTDVAVAGGIPDYTVTSVLRDSGKTLLDVVTPSLSDALIKTASITTATAPLLTSAVAVLQAIETTKQVPMSVTIPQMAGVLEGAEHFVPEIPATIASFTGIPGFGDPNKVAELNDLLTQASHLILDWAGRLAASFSPIAPWLTMLTSLLRPTNEQLRQISPAQVGQLLSGLSGAFHTRPKADGTGESTQLDVELLIAGFPAFSTPLQLAAPTLPPLPALPSLPAVPAVPTPPAPAAPTATAPGGGN